MRLADVKGDGEFRLLAADSNKQLRVYKGMHMFLDQFANVRVLVPQCYDCVHPANLISSC